MTVWTVCEECSNPVALFSKGWYRCRMCGHESLRDLQPAARSERSYTLAALSHSADMENAARAEGAKALGLSPLSISDK